MRSRLVTIYIMMCSPLALMAQIGDYRNGLAIGFNGGYVLSNIGFNPNVSQTFHNGMSGGLTIRYVSEKYFKTICSIQGEINFTQAGWKENIVDVNKNKVINPITGQNEAYQRTINYLQIPIFAHLAWGREQKGVNFFVQAGPQVGLYLNESTSTNFNLEQRNTEDRANNIVAQDTMAVEKKIDYGIAAGLGLEYSIPKVGHFMLEGRYYYGLGDIFRNTKRDYFGKSNIGNIIIKLTYLFDITKTKI